MDWAPPAVPEPVPVVEPVPTPTPTPTPTPEPVEPVGPPAPPTGSPYDPGGPRYVEPVDITSPPAQPPTPAPVETPALPQQPIVPPIIPPIITPAPPPPVPLTPAPPITTPTTTPTTVPTTPVEPPPAQPPTDTGAPVEDATPKPNPNYTNPPVPNPLLTAAQIAAGWTIVNGILTPPPTTPTWSGYAPLAPWVPAAGQKINGPGLNPGLIGTVKPFYHTTNPVQAQFYWGQHPYMATAADLANYNNIPNAPAVPWGAQHGYEPFNVQQFIQQNINPTTLAAAQGAGPTVGPVAPY